MKKYLFILSATLFVVFTFAANIPKASAQTLETSADTLMNRVFAYAQNNGGHIGRFENIVYTKFHIDSNVRNFLLKLLPHSIDFPKGKRHIFGESITRYNYLDLGIINRKEIAFYSSMRKLRKIPDILHNNVNALIYEPTIYIDYLLSPFNKKNRSHYKYAIEVVSGSGTGKKVMLAFTPKYDNTQLVEGTAWIEYETGRVESVIFNAVYDRILHVNVNLRTGKDGLASLLPQQTYIKLQYKWGGNTVSMSLDSHMYYENLGSTNYTDSLRFIAGRKQYDITELNLIPHDTTGVVRTREYFDNYRPQPLTSWEDSIYSSIPLSVKNNTTSSPNHAKKKEKTASIEDLLLSSHSVDFNENTTLALPAVITPSMFQWSGSRGVSLQARLRFNVNFPRGQYLKLSPRVGYSFKQKQVYWNVPLNVLIFPSIGMGFEATVRNGNHIYSSLQAREVRKELEKYSDYDSLLNVFNKYNFNYYNDFYTGAAFYIEPVVGLKIHSGLSFHKRNLINWNNVASSNGMKRHYKSIAPYIDLEYTPALYYTRASGRRIPVHTSWPTFRMSYEKGVRWWTCDNRYERWEFDASYKINLKALSSIYIRAGGGLFTDRKEMYFVDYDNFSFQNMPTGWDDDMLGDFQLLDRHWYNESNYYALLCTAYESPMLLLSRVPLISKIIKKERVYLNAVSLHALNAYVEGGYGISSDFFDGAVFFGGGNASGFQFGAKISLRFFDNW